MIVVDKQKVERAVKFTPAKGIVLFSIFIAGLVMCTNEKEVVKPIEVQPPIVAQVTPPMPPAPEVEVQSPTEEVKPICALETEQEERLYKKVTTRYSTIDPTSACKIVVAAVKYSTENFEPSDILALIDTASNFKVDAVAKGYDPARGLTQIRHGIWNEHVYNRDMSIIDNQVEVAVKILEHYRSKIVAKKAVDVHDIGINAKQSTISAYSMGLTAHLNGAYNFNYVEKFEKAKNYYSQ